MYLYYIIDQLALYFLCQGHEGNRGVTFIIGVTEHRKQENVITVNSQYRKVEFISRRLLTSQSKFSGQ